MALIQLRHCLTVAGGHLCHQLGVELGLVDGIPGHERTVAWVWSPFGLNGLAVSHLARLREAAALHVGRPWPC